MIRARRYGRLLGSVRRVLRTGLFGAGSPTGTAEGSAWPPALLDTASMSVAQREYVAAGLARSTHDSEDARRNHETKLIYSVMIQRLSGFSEYAPSAYFDLDLKSRDVLDIAFTHAQMPAGTFSFHGVYGYSPHSVLHLNTTDSDYYQNGIPGATRSIAETVSWLQAIRSSFGFATVRTIGASMAGYASILFGDLVNADLICAISPVIDPMYTFLGKAARFVDVGEALLRIKGRSTIMFGAFDVLEYKLLASCLDLGMDLGDLAVVGNGHGPIGSLNLLKFTTSAGHVPAGELMVNPHTIPLDHAMVREVGGLPLYSPDRDDNQVVEVLARAAAIDTINPDFRYRLGVHLGLLGRGDEAVEAFRDAIALNEYHIKKIGSDVFGVQADYEKRIVRDYGVYLDFARLKSLVALIKDAAGSAHLSRLRPSLIDGAV
jgi:hypothetical protein